ncbi:MAG: hypothetical protein AAF432_16310 [Planctomycetota bacterium]
MLWINRILRGTKAAYVYVAFAIIFCEFLITFPLMLYPPVAILMVFFGILTLVVATIGYKVLGVVVNTSNRQLLRRAICPACQAHTIEETMQDESRTGWSCGNCDVRFDAHGADIDPNLRVDGPAATVQHLQHA